MHLRSSEPGDWALYILSRSGDADRVPSLLSEQHINRWVMLLQDPSNLLTGNANGYVGGQIYFDAFNVSLSGFPPSRSLSSFEQ